MRCVAASVAGVQRLSRASGPEPRKTNAATMPNKGAVRKKRNGTESGGAWVRESPDRVVILLIGIVVGGVVVFWRQSRRPREMDQVI